jgi:hypothetical protein
MTDLTSEDALHEQILERIACKRLDVECSALQAQISAASGAVLDAGFTGDTTPTTAIYALVEERDSVRSVAAGLAALVDRMLATFWQSGHPGQSCKRSEWVRDSTVASWRDALGHARSLLTPTTAGQGSPTGEVSPEVACVTPEPAVVGTCWCRDCHPMSPFMILCPDCGNKRCPRASFHGHDCTASNEPGQRGSFYGEPCEHLSGGEG